MNTLKQINKLSDSSLKFILGNIEPTKIHNIYDILKNNKMKSQDYEILENSTEAGSIFYSKKNKLVKVLSIYNDDYYELYNKKDFIKILDFILNIDNIDDIDDIEIILKKIEV